MPPTSNSFLPSCARINFGQIILSRDGEETILESRINFT